MYSTYQSLAYPSDDDGGNGGEGAGIFGEEGAKVFGSLALGLLALSFGYVLLKRGYIYSQRYLPKDEYKELITLIKRVYFQFRKPMFWLHVTVNIVATIFAVIHGYSFLGNVENIILYYAGIIAALAMIILTISGIIMWRRFWPMWDYKEPRKLIRWLHRQWFFTGILLLALAFHLLFGEIGGD